MKNIGYITAVFSILLFFAASYFRPAATFSEIENRYLTDFVNPDMENVRQSEWQKQITEAANDQVIFRDWFVELTVAAKRLAGQKDAGGVYFGKDGYYIEKVLDSDVSLTQYRKNLQIVDQAIKTVSEQTASSMEQTVNSIGQTENTIEQAVNSIGQTENTVEQAVTNTNQAENSIDQSVNNFDQTANAVKRIENTEEREKDSDIQLHICLVPSSGVILKDKLPEGASIYEDTLYYQTGQELFGDKWLDIRSDLREAAQKQQIYFRTDHHWTTYGAYVGASAFLQAEKGDSRYADSLESSVLESSTLESSILDSSITELSASENKKTSEKKNLRPIEDYGLMETKEKFYGTLYSKAPYPGAAADLLVLPEKLGTYQVTIDGGETQNSIYHDTYLTQKDKYAVYFGGNYGTVRIKNHNASIMMPLNKTRQTGTFTNTRKKLVLIKDSYANSMVPYLISSYDEILMIDLRYYNDSFQKMMQEEQPDTVLVLYEMTSFMKCDTLFKLLR